MVDYHDLHSVTPCRCSKCRGITGPISSSLGNSHQVRKNNYNRSHLGRNLGIVFMVIAIAVGIFAYAMNFGGLKNYADSMLSASKAATEASLKTSSQNGNDVSTSTSTTTPSRTTTTTISQPQQQSIKHVEYYTEQVTDKVLDRGILLRSGGDSYTLDIQIPRTDVNEMTGTISVQGPKFVEVQFLDESGELYCSNCKYDISGSKYVIIPVKGGDSISVKVTNPKDADLQTINFDLEVTYPETKERVTYEKVEQQPSSTPIIPAQPLVPTPLTTYTKCDFGIMDQGSRASCTKPSFKVLLLETTPKLREVLAKAGIKIGDAPPIALFYDVKVEQYDETNFVVIITDTVGEKRYPTQLWELPS